jgi:hypothetical protein
MYQHDRQHRNLGIITELPSKCYSTQRCGANRDETLRSAVEKRLVRCKYR